MKNTKGFIVSLLVVIIATLIIGGGVYIFVNKKVEAPVVVLPDISNTLPTSTKPVINTTKPSVTGANLKYNGADFQFEYPPLLSLRQASGNIVLEHSVLYKHMDPCDFKGDGIALEKLTDFSVSFQLLNQSLDNYLKSSEFPGQSYTYNSPFTIGSLNGYKVQFGVEGCGYINYYFPISTAQALVIERHLVTELGDTIMDKQKYLSIPGIILPTQEELIINQILTSLKFGN